MTILVGTSGWSYDDWVGPVYAPALKPEHWLEAYAARFPTVEINSTFYRLPPASTVRAWVERSRPLEGFEFSVKVPEEATHRALLAKDGARVGEVLAALDATVLRPLAAAGRLGAVLFQLAPRFSRTPEHLAALDDALGHLAGRSLAVEFRHASWVEGVGLAPEAAALLARHGAAACVVDGPSFPLLVVDVGRDAYVRFHGRRYDAWHERPGDGSDARLVRYDYLYGAEELGPWPGRLRAIDARHRTTRVYWNNHVGGKAVANGEALQRLLGLAPPRRAARQATLDGLGGPANPGFPGENR